MVFDGSCGFCRRWITRWQRLTGSVIDYCPFQEERIAVQFPEIDQQQFAAAVHLVESDGRVSFGAEAVFRSLALALVAGVV
jgi:lipase maturation factor 1